MANVRSVRDCTATFRPAGFFALRTPALPFDTLASWADGPSGSAEMRGAPTGCEVAELRERLRAIVRRPEVREALFVASPTLDTQLDVWLATPAPEAEEMLRIERRSSAMSSGWPGGRRRSGSSPGRASGRSARPRASRSPGRPGTVGRRAWIPSSSARSSPDWRRIRPCAAV